MSRSTRQAATTGADEVEQELAGDSKAQEPETLEQHEASVDRVPAVSVKSRGRISRHLEMIAMNYEARHVVGDRKTRVTRWVYAPQHKPELSNVVGRRMDKWKVVMVEEIPEEAELLDLRADQAVRSGDLVLMWTTPENRAKLQQEEREKALSQVQAVNEAHKEGMANLRVPGKQMTEEHEVRPRGRSVIEERELEFDYSFKDATEKEG